MKSSQDTSCVSPDVQIASDAYAERFSGPVGRWFLKVQEAATLRMLAPYPGASVLDVGGGHGQTAEPLIREGYDLTVLGSSYACKARIADLVRKNDCDFRVGSILSLPFGDDAFDVVMSYRMVAHVQNWRSYLSELARVARYSVIIDYPELMSFNFVEPLLFRFKKRIEGNTRPYRCLRMKEVLSLFRDENMQYSDRYCQFFWPMAVHRMLNTVQVSAAAESLCRRLGLTERLGSPVILKVSRMSGSRN